MSLASRTRDYLTILIALTPLAPSPAKQERECGPLAHPMGEEIKGEGRHPVAAMKS